VTAAPRPARSARRRAVLALLGVALATAAGAAAAADAGLAELMQRLAGRRHGHAAFVERQFLAILDRPLESSGELYYDAPDRLEKRTLAPKPESLVLERGTLSVTRGTRHYALALRDYPEVAPFIDSIRATLAGDLAALERAYALSFAAGGPDWTLTLVPREARLARLIARIRMAGVDDQVREVTVERADGDHSVLTIRELAGD
jgi:hypothetical protein